MKRQRDSIEKWVGARDEKDVMTSVPGAVAGGSQHSTPSRREPRVSTTARWRVGPTLNSPTSRANARLTHVASRPSQHHHTVVTIDGGSAKPLKDKKDKKSADAPTPEQSEGAELDKKR